MAGATTAFAAPSATVVVIMGVSGAGKTTVGEALAKRLGWPFQEGDAFHPQANVAKMRSGAPLSDADRAPWLARVKAWISDQLASGRSGVISCSALKHTYRTTLVGGRDSVRLVQLKGDEQLIRERLERRRGHFMPASLLDSQLALLESPAPLEHVIVIDIDQPVEAQVEQIVAAMGRHTKEISS